MYDFGFLTLTGTSLGEVKGLSSGVVTRGELVVASESEADVEEQGSSVVGETGDVGVELLLSISLSSSAQRVARG